MRSIRADGEYMYFDVHEVKVKEKVSVFAMSMIGKE